MVGNETKYFDIYGLPKDIDIKKYLKVYEIFCNVYGIAMDKENTDRFSDEVTLKILNRKNPEGITYRPKTGGNTSDARLFVTPLRNMVRFYAFSYGGGNYTNTFIQESLASKELGARTITTKNLETKLQ